MKNLNKILLLGDKKRELYHKTTILCELGIQIYQKMKFIILRTNVRLAVKPKIESLNIKIGS